MPAHVGINPRLLSVIPGPATQSPPERNSINVIWAPMFPPSFLPNILPCISFLASICSNPMFPALGPLQTSEGLSLWNHNDWTSHSMCGGIKPHVAEVSPRSLTVFWIQSNPCGEASSQGRSWDETIPSPSQPPLFCYETRKPPQWPLYVPPAFATDLFFLWDIHI